MALDKVLIVEDNAMNMELALTILEQIDCETLQAVTAEEGIRLAIAESPTLILMDVSLPGMDGISAVRILKQNEATKEIPVVVLTAHAMRGDESEAVAAGCDGYLSKPISVREFMQTVARFLSE